MRWWDLFHLNGRFGTEDAQVFNRWSRRSSRLPGASLRSALERALGPYFLALDGSRPGIGGGFADVGAAAARLTEGRAWTVARIEGSGRNASIGDDQKSRRIFARTRRRPTRNENQRCAENGPGS